MYDFHLYVGKWSNLTNIFFRWVETSNLLSTCYWGNGWPNEDIWKSNCTCSSRYGEGTWAGVEVANWKCPQAAVEVEFIWCLKRCVWGFALRVVYIPIINTWDPNDLYFWKVNPQKQALFQPKQGSFGFYRRIYIYINTALRIYCSHDTQSRTAQRISDTMHVWWLHFVAVPHRSHHERGNIGASSWFRSDMWWDCWVHWQAFEKYGSLGKKQTHTYLHMLYKKHKFC